MNSQKTLANTQNNKNAQRLRDRKTSSELIKGVAWSKIKNIPEDWKSNNLERSIDLQTGNNFSSENFVDKGGLPLIRIRDLPTGETETNYQGEYDDQYIITPKDLLVGMDGEFKPYLWKGEKALLNQRILKIESEEYNKFFLRYSLEKPLRYIQKSISGTTVKHLSQKDIKKINLPTPEPPEQRKIASVLYNVDRAIQKTEEIIEQTQRVKKGLMQDLFTEGYYSHEEFEEKSRFGKIPAEWKVKKLKEISDVVGGSTPNTKEKEYWGGEIPWVTPTELTDLEANTLEETDRNITEEGLNSSSAELLPPKSLLLTSRASIGMCAINDVEMATNQGFQSLVPDEEVDVWYLMYRMRFESPYLNSLGAGSTFSEVSNSMMKKVEIPIPAKEEQVKIGETLRDVDEQIFSLKEEKKQLQRLKKGLMQDLLTGEVRTKDKDIEVLDEVMEVEKSG